MRTVKLSTAKDLERFLKILAEESVMTAKAGMSAAPVPDEKQRQKSMVQKIRKDKAELSEDEEPIEDTASVTATAASTEPPPDDKSAVAPKKPAAPIPSSASASDINPTISSVIDAIKEIRGGRGSGDSAVEAELTAYFDRLDEAEKTSLVVMLRSLGGIMRQQMTGADAPEPEQYQIFTSMKPSEKEKAAPSAEVTPKAGEEESAEEPEGENTAPPIKVGAPVSEAYRTKIRDLLSRNR